MASLDLRSPEGLGCGERLKMWWQQWDVGLVRLGAGGHWLVKIGGNFGKTHLKRIWGGFDICFFQSIDMAVSNNTMQRCQLLDVLNVHSGHYRFVFCSFETTIKRKYRKFKKPASLPTHLHAAGVVALYHSYFHSPYLQATTERLCNLSLRTAFCQGLGLFVVSMIVQCVAMVALVGTPIRSYCAFACKVRMVKGRLKGFRWPVLMRVNI